MNPTIPTHSSPVRRIRSLIPATVLACSLLAGQGRAEIEWAASRDEAVARATRSGKLVLVLAGRVTCGNCTYMKNTVCESASVRPLLDAGYVCWFCPVDDTTEWYPYASGLGGFTLPLIAVLDPGEPLGHLDRSTGIMVENDFAQRLASHLPSSRTEISRFVLASSPDGTCEIRFRSAPGHFYRLQSSADLSEWRFEGNLRSGDGSMLVETVNGDGSGKRFFRVFGYR